MKRVTVNHDSWHYKFNQWTYGKSYFPTNLCPYFWKTILAFVIIPFVLIGKAIYKLPEFPDWSISENTTGKIEKIVKTVLLAGVTVVFGLLIAFQEWGIILIILGVTGVGAGIIGFAMWVIWLYEGYREAHPKIVNNVRQKHKRNMVIAKTSGWYHKNCPMLVVE